MSKKNGWLMYPSWSDQINLLSDEDAGKLFMALSQRGTLWGMRCL